MPSRRDQITMSPEERAAFLDEERVLNIATIGPDGYPHVVAMWYAVIDGDVTFWTFGKAQKVINLQRDPKISALVEAGDEYSELRGLEIVGTAELIDDPDQVFEIGRAVAARYQGAVALSEAALGGIAKQAQKRIGVRIKAERYVSWDHRKLGGGY